MKKSNKTTEICCPIFNPNPWDNSIFEWKNKCFIKDSVFTLMYIPINFGSVMKRIVANVKVSEIVNPDYLCLSEHTSLWNMNVYLAVEEAVPNAENVQLTGKFFSKVYEGSFNELGKWTKDFELTVKAKGLVQKKMYMWYTTCPKCAKKYGKNYVAIIASIE